ncbi:hypothetical protein [Actinoallomurus rhizosphaericola]|uniref:hypothetical protein n=1 Tax=Actinoallomurus rhizosphaericola TaxID=2952536 RepID=UPI0020928AD4|nr:hypothetical protein [Actinoallomurus rhizosphaericola]MCO5997632.1 hypothetical protein [Actinoallomurus rhizosphaericola]
MMSGGGGRVGGRVFGAVERFLRFEPGIPQAAHVVGRLPGGTAPVIYAARHDTHAALVDAVAHGRETQWLTRRALTEVGPEGSRALQILDRYRPEIRYTHGTGSLYEPSANTVTIDLDNGHPGVGLVHELTHVEWTHQGRAADIMTMARHDYVGRKLGEETDASVRQIYAHAHLQTSQPHLNLPDTTLQPEFTQGYGSAVHEAETAAQAQGRVLTPEERALAGDTGGRQAVYGAFQNGQVRTSGPGSPPYPQFVGETWDAYRQSLREYGLL